MCKTDEQYYTTVANTNAKKVCFCAFKMAE